MSCAYSAFSFECLGIMKLYCACVNVMCRVLGEVCLFCAVVDGCFPKYRHETIPNWQKNVAADTVVNTCIKT